MKKVSIIALMFMAVFFINNVYADEMIITNPENITIKYYKTTIIKNNSGIFASSENVKSYVEEVSEEEYNLADSNISVTDGNVTIENTYQKLTTSISTIGSYYRYNADVEWKSIPSTRSYDTIGIGFPSNVRKLGGLYFEQIYCTSSTNCNTSTSYLYSYSGTNGVGVTFQQPSGSLYSLKHHMHFNVTKNTTATIYAQHAYGAFAHANTSVSLSDAEDYIVNANGIVFQNGVGSYYNILGVAEATWNGVW